MKKKRIGVVIQEYGQIGGSESFAFNLTERLANFNDFEIHVFANEWEKSNSSIIFHKVPIISFPRWLKPISFAYFASKAAQKNNCQIIHSHDRIFNMDILSFHGIPHITWVKKIKKKYLSLFDRATVWIEKKSFINNDSILILPVSNQVKEELLDVYNISEKCIEVCHPGIEIKKFSCSDTRVYREKIRKQYNLSLNDDILLFVGMNFEVKRLDLVLKAMANLSSNIISSLKLLVVGKGNVKYYLKMAKDLGISENVIFTGVISNINEYYFASDIFILPSQFDTFGLVVLEAMASGLPVIISQMVGAKDIIQSEINGIILPDNPTPINIADVLKSLMNHNYRKSLSQKAKKTAQKYSWDNYVNKMITIYNNKS